LTFATLTRDIVKETQSYFRDSRTSADLMKDEMFVPISVS